MKVKNPKSIKKYKVKGAAGFSLRQIVYSIAGLAVAAALFALFRLLLPYSAAIFVALLLSSPIFLSGFLMINGVSLGKCIWVILTAKPRYYQRREPFTHGKK
ncbi:MAG: PrgI family mobile element protein [Acutalibacteraceae bacterium]